MVPSLSRFQITDIVRSKLLLIKKSYHKINGFWRVSIRTPNNRNETKSKLRSIVELLLGKLNQLRVHLWTLLYYFSHFFYRNRVLRLYNVTRVHSLSWHRHTACPLLPQHFWWARKGISIWNWLTRISNSLKIFLLNIFQFVSHLFNFLLKFKFCPYFSLYLFLILIFNHLLLFKKTFFLCLELFLELSLKRQIIFVLRLLHLLFFLHYLHPLLLNLFL